MGGINAAGRIRVAVVGSSEAPITPEIVEGFGNMSALANEEGLKKLDGSDKADHRRTCSGSHSSRIGLDFIEKVRLTLNANGANHGLTIIANGLCGRARSLILVTPRKSQL